MSAILIFFFDTGSNFLSPLFYFFFIAGAPRDSFEVHRQLNKLLQGTASALGFDNEDLMGVINKYLEEKGITNEEPKGYLNTIFQGAITSGFSTNPVKDTTDMVNIVTEFLRSDDMSIAQQVADQAKTVDGIQFVDESVSIVIMTLSNGLVAIKGSSLKNPGLWTTGRNNLFEVERAFQQEARRFHTETKITVFNKFGSGLRQWCKLKSNPKEMAAQKAAEQAQQMKDENERLKAQVANMAELQRQIEELKALQAAAAAAENESPPKRRKTTKGKTKGKAKATKSEVTVDSEDEWNP